MHRFLTQKIIAVVLLLTATTIKAQITTLDEFETKNGWSFIQSDGVNLNLSVEKGLTGNAIRFDYDFTKGTGYGGFQKFFPIDLPDNFEFTFYIKAESPANNFEIKFIDSTGNNVWWLNNRNYDFPKDWKKIRIKKLHIGFAWGPTEDQTLKRIDRIEFTVASFVGGKGTLWIDDLKFEPLLPERESYPAPIISASSSVENHTPEFMLDGQTNTYWQSSGDKDQFVLIDFTTRREFGGLHINWLKDHYARSYEVLLSEDGRIWESAYSVHSNQGDVSFIRLPETESKYVKISLSESAIGKGFGVSEIKFLHIKESMTPNDFLIYTAKNSPVGDFPRYFLEQASYWTISGVNNDVKEAMINEDGMVEVDKGLFSIEPMIRIGDSIYNWSNFNSGQSLGFDDGQNFLFLPTVNWSIGQIQFTTQISSGGKANESSVLNINYSFENHSVNPTDVELYLLIRPFQVNPFYQWLNLAGGAGKINSIQAKNRVIFVDEKEIISKQEITDFGAGIFDEGNMVDLLRQGLMPENKEIVDRNGLAGGVIKYAIHLDADKRTEINIMVPYYDGQIGTSEMDSFDDIFNNHENDYKFWQKKVDHIKFNLPESADRILNTYKANLVYVLINRDHAGIQPGSRSYERSWIRDGALTSSSLLKSGIVPEVKDFIEWYSAHLYENGKVPCVVDFRGPDPVPENDSHGEFIYLIREYFNFTKDTAFLKSQNDNILKVVEYIESLIAERSTDHYKFGNDSIRAHYGLVPESISHEGYSAKPMHSYWDNFFTMKGLKDAAEIQKILGKTADYERIGKIRDTFRENLYNSLDLAMKYKGIYYIPGCVELGDFDATSTTIALTPCNELRNLPKPQVYNTFDKYYEIFKERRDGKRDWLNYTPYENRLIGSFILLDQPERAHELIKFFLHDQRPQGWSHWAVVVWKEYRYPGFIGDMPHTWVGSDFINAIRSMFVYENEYDQSLVLASALYQDWIDVSEGMSVENLPTYYGEISYSIKKEKDRYRFSITGEVKPPDNGIKIRNFNGSKLPKKVVINGSETKDFTAKEIPVKMFPAVVEIYY